jgi:hypothetical protein
MKKILFLLIVGVGTILAAKSVPAVSFTYPLNFEFTDDGVEPAGEAPWLTALVSDNGDDTVRITMSTFGLTGDEFVSGWYFNIDDVSKISSGALISEETTGPISFGITLNDDSIAVDEDSFNVGGEGGARFDILFNFPTPSPSSSGDRFDADEIVVFDFMGTGLTALDFYVKDTTGNYFTAAHVQGIGENGEGSGKIGATQSIAAIPEPATIILLGASLLSLLGFGRFKFKK